MSQGHKVKRLPSGDVAVEQCRVNGLDITENPDDGRFYVCKPGEAVPLATFKDLRNAVQYAKKHQ